MILKEFLKTEGGVSTSLSLFIDSTFDNKYKMSMFKTVYSEDNDQFDHVFTELLDEPTEVLNEMEDILISRGYKDICAERGMEELPSMLYKELPAESIPYPVYVQSKLENKCFCEYGVLYDNLGVKYEDPELQYQAFRVHDDIGDFECYVKEGELVLSEVMMEKIPFKNRLYHLQNTRDTMKIVNTILVKNEKELKAALDYLSDTAYIFKPRSMYIKGQHKSQAFVSNIMVLRGECENSSSDVLDKIKQFV